MKNSMKRITVGLAAALCALVIAGCASQTASVSEPVDVTAATSAPPAVEPEPTTATGATPGFHVAVQKYRDQENVTPPTEDFSYFQREGAIAVWIRDTRTNEVTTWAADGYALNPSVEKALAAGDRSGPFFDLPSWNNAKNTAEGGKVRDAATSGLAPAWQAFAAFPTGDPLEPDYISKQ